MGMYGTLDRENQKRVKWRSGLGAVLIFLALEGVSESCAAQEIGALLQRIRHAGGPALRGNNEVFLSEGRTEKSGLNGSERLEENVRSGAFVKRDNLGDFAQAEGFDGTVHWRQDRSGGVHKLNGDFTAAYDRSTAWLVRRAYLKPALEGADVKVVEDQGHVNFVRLTVTPKAGTPLDLWFGKDTMLLTRVYRQMPTKTVYEFLSDYQSVRGMLLPFSLESGEVDGPDVDRFRVSRYQMLKGVEEGAFAMPVAPTDTELQRPSRVPAFTKGFVAVSVKLNDQGNFTFVLDTGGHNILTPATVKRLGLTPVGLSHEGGAGSGKLEERSVSVKKVQVGEAVMHDQYFSVIDLFPSPPWSGTVPDGMIGLEFLERLRVQIDYGASAVMLSPFDTLPGSCSGAFVKITFNDDMPLVPGRLDGVDGLLGVDTGNNGSTAILGVWAKANKVAADLRSGKESVSYGAGGETKQWSSDGHEISVGSMSVPGLEFRYTEDQKGAFSSLTEAANVGHDFLEHFRVTFDYQHSTVCLESPKEAAVTNPGSAD